MLMLMLALLAAAPAWTAKGSFYELREGAPSLCGVGLAAGLSPKMAPNMGPSMAAADARSKLSHALQTRITQVQLKTPDGKVVSIKTDAQTTLTGVEIADTWFGDGKTFSKACLDLRAAAASFATGDGDVSVEGLTKDQNKALTEALLKAAETELKAK